MEYLILILFASTLLKLIGLWLKSNQLIFKFGIPLIFTGSILAFTPIAYEMNWIKIDKTLMLNDNLWKVETLIWLCLITKLSNEISSNRAARIFEKLIFTTTFLMTQFFVLVLIFMYSPVAGFFKQGLCLLIFELAFLAIAHFLRSKSMDWLLTVEMIGLFSSAIFVQTFKHTQFSPSGGIKINEELRPLIQMLFLLPFLALIVLFGEKTMKKLQQLFKPISNT